MEDFITFMKEYNTINMYSTFKKLPTETRRDLGLQNAMRHFDHTVNVKWVMAHFKAAEHYLESDGETKEATGGSHWKKYMLPRYQKRIFFPSLWTEEEHENWGITNLEGYAKLENPLEV